MAVSCTGAAFECLGPDARAGGGLAPQSLSGCFLLCFVLLSWRCWRKAGSGHHLGTTRRPPPRLFDAGHGAIRPDRTGSGSGETRDRGPLHRLPRPVCASRTGAASGSPGCHRRGLVRKLPWSGGIVAAQPYASGLHPRRSGRRGAGSAGGSLCPRQYLRRLSRAGGGGLARRRAS